MKISSSLNRLFYIFCVAVFGWLFLSIIISWFGKGDVGASALTVLTGAVIFAVLVFANQLIERTNATDKKISTVSVIVISFMGLAMIVFGYLMRMEESGPNDGWDFNAVYKGAMGLACYNSLDHLRGYLQNFNINIPAVYFLGGFFRLVLLFTGDVPAHVGILFNVFLIMTSIVFVWLIIKKTLGGKTALLAMIICALYPATYVYAPIYYTDTFALPFLTGAIYFYICGIDTGKLIEQRKITPTNRQKKKQEETSGITLLQKKYLLLTLSAILAAYGFVLKGSVGIIIIAIIIFTLLRKDTFKSKLLICIPFVVCLVLFSLINTTFIKNSKVLDLDPDLNFPVTHTLMMAFNPNTNGGYSYDDVLFTASFATYDEKVKGTTDELFHRISDMGFGGTLSYIQKNKNLVNWGDGLFYAQHKLGRGYTSHNPLHDLVLTSGKHHKGFYLYSQGFWLAIKALMLVSLLSSLKSKRDDYAWLFDIALFGVMLLFMFWETRARYLYSFLPLFILIATNGLSQCSAILQKLKRGNT